MAYRFLLEVPEALAAEASVAVAETDDAQVVLARNSHGLGFDDPYVDLTIAAHSLAVIDSLYDWFDRLGASQPTIRIVLHSGDRVPLEEVDRGAMIAAIRRDQPWVERTIPKIGEHEQPSAEAYADDVRAREELSIDAAGANVEGATSETGLVATARTAVVERSPEPRVRIRQINHITIRVNDLAKAERFYTDFFAMELLGRTRRTAAGKMELLDGAYDWATARREGTEADVSYLRNGPLQLAVVREGRGARLERTVLDSISIAVDATTFTDLKGQILMRSYETLAAAETALVFRDPFGVAWELRILGSVEPDYAAS